MPEGGERLRGRNGQIERVTEFEAVTVGPDDDRVCRGGKEDKESSA